MSRSTRPLLLFAEPLQRQGLIEWLRPLDLPVLEAAQDQAGAPASAPALVLWSLAAPLPQATLLAELRRLQERWQPAPLLLLLPGGHGYPTRFLLDLPLQGLIEAASPEALRQSVSTLLAGGRVVEIAAASSTPADAAASSPFATAPLGLGQWLLLSGLQQIDAERRVCLGLLEPVPPSALAELLLRGRLRELAAARQLLLWLWGPLSLAWGLPGGAGPDDPLGPDQAVAGGESQPGLAPGALVLTLRQRTADGIWEALRERLLQAARCAPENRTGQLLALDGLQPDRRTDLLVALIEQFEQLRRQLQAADLRQDGLLDRWRELQPELRRQALSRMAGSYVQLPCEGGLLPVASTLAQRASLGFEDPEVPEPVPMLATLVEARPLLVEGRLLAADEPQAVLYLEMLLANWLLRNAELISGEVLAGAADWPELRRYLLRPELLPTRNLERLRNRLNAQQRWTSWIERPIRLYESRRSLYCLEAGGIRSVALTEPRDRELRQLGWPQQLVTLALEARDALAPQLQVLVRSLGDLVVVLLTRVIGRAIGLVGRGIAQGMGRSMGKG
jgi:hypothetical protein